MKKKEAQQHHFEDDILSTKRITEKTTSPKHSVKTKPGKTERSSSKDRKIVITYHKQPQKYASKASKSKDQLSSPSVINQISSPSVKKSKCESEYYINIQPKPQNSNKYKMMQFKLKQKDIYITTIHDRLNKNQSLIRKLEEQTEIKDQRIEDLQTQLKEMFDKYAKQSQAVAVCKDVAFEYERFKVQQKRLLRMLEMTSEYQYFAKFALEDNGVSFLRFPNQSRKSNVDAASIHHCTCSQQFISQKGFWVPQKMYDFGKQFIKERNGQFTYSEYQLLLYQLNRIWRQREKKIVNSLKGAQALQIDKYKRKAVGSVDPLRKFQKNR